MPFVVGPVAANFEAVMSGNGISRCVQCLNAIRTYLWFLSLKALLIPPRFVAYNHRRREFKFKDRDNKDIFFLPFMFGDPLGRVQGPQVRNL